MDLPAIRKTVFFGRLGRGGSLIAARECWEAETTDGQWVFVREESPGTPWLVRRREDGEIVGMAGTLRKARQLAVRVAAS